jgi:hypothetical protein
MWAGSRRRKPRDNECAASHGAFDANAELVHQPAQLLLGQTAPGPQVGRLFRAVQVSQLEVEVTAVEQNPRGVADAAHSERDIGNVLEDREPVDPADAVDQYTREIPSAA